MMKGSILRLGQTGMMQSKPLFFLKLTLYFIAIFHLVLGAGMMLSVDFQKILVQLYTQQLYTQHLNWDLRDIYYTRILGSFAFVLGTLAWAAARDPLKHQIIIIAFIEFFILRNINRHLFSEELYTAFAVSPEINLLTTCFFSLLALALGGLLWRVRKEIAAPHHP